MFYMQSLKELMTKYNQNVSFPLLGKQLTISSKRILFYHLKNKYNKIADEAVKTFKKRFMELTSMDDLLSNIDNLLVISLADGVQEVAQDAVSVNAYSLDVKSIMSLCIKENYFDPFIQVCKKIADEDDAIISRLENAKAYRSARKATRSRWTATTYNGDMLDAWGNQFKAAQMNAIEGVGHSIRNAIGNMWDEAEADEKRAALFHNTAYQKEMADSIWTCASNLQLVITNKLNQSCSLNLGGWVSDSDYQKAESMFINLTTMQMSDKQKKECAFQIIQLNPFVSKYYIELIRRYFDSADEILNIARLFQMSSVEEEAINLLVASANEMAGDTEQEVIDCKLAMRKCAKKCTLSEKALQPVMDVIDAHGTEALKKYLNSCTLQSDDDVVQCRTALKEMAQRMETPQSELNTVLGFLRVRAEKLFRDYIGTYQTRSADDVISLRNTVKEKAKILDQPDEVLASALGMVRTRAEIVVGTFINQNCGQTEDEAKACLEAAIGLAQKMGYNEKAVSEPIQKLKDKITQFDIDYRTVDGVLMQTRESADRARKDVSSHGDVLHQDLSAFHYKYEFLGHLQKLRALTVQEDLKTKYLDECQKAMNDFDTKCQIASAWQWRLEHHNNKFYNGNAVETIIMYVVAAFLIYKMLIAFIEHGGFWSRVIWTVLAVGSIIFILSSYASEKNAWNELTSNGQLKLTDVMSSTPPTQIEVKPAEQTVPKSS